MLSRGFIVSILCGDKCPYGPGLQRDDWPLWNPKGLLIEEVRAIRNTVKQLVQKLVEEERVKPIG